MEYKSTIFLCKKQLGDFSYAFFKSLLLSIGTQLFKSA